MTGDGGMTGACRGTEMPSFYQRRHPPSHTPPPGTTPSSALAHTATRHNAVILREVAVSIVACRGRWIFWGVRWQAEMDSATARRMTKFGCSGHFGDEEECVGGPRCRRFTNAVIRPRTHRHPTQRRHTARSRSIHSGVQRALDFLGGALAGGDGFCDCAQNDEVWVQRVLRE